MKLPRLRLQTLVMSPLWVAGLIGLLHSPSFANWVRIEGRAEIYDTIQEAINAAPDGATIEIGPGTYYESPWWRDRSLILRGERCVNDNASDPREMRPPTVIKGGVAASASDAYRPQSVAIECLGIDGSEVTTPAVLHFEVTQLTMKNCTVWGSGSGVGVGGYLPQSTSIGNCAFYDFNTAIHLNFDPSTTPESMRTLAANGLVFRRVAYAIAAHHVSSGEVVGIDYSNHGAVQAAIDRGDPVGILDTVNRLTDGRRSAAILLQDSDRVRIADCMLCTGHHKVFLHRTEDIELERVVMGIDTDVVEVESVAEYLLAAPDEAAFVARYNSAKGTGVGLNDYGGRNTLVRNSSIYSYGYGISLSNTENFRVDGVRVEETEISVIAETTGGDSSDPRYRVVLDGIWLGEEGERPGCYPVDPYRITQQPLEERRPEGWGCISDHGELVQRPILLLQEPPPALPKCPELEFRKKAKK